MFDGNMFMNIATIFYPSNVPVENVLLTQRALSVTRLLSCVWDTRHYLVKDICDYFKWNGTFYHNECFMYRMKQMV